ncbi:MAG TPA: restriction endonuclease subunit S [Bacteroidetes bacterium]|mgnify:CR=1 FL=1|nr:restriction endonuclease subunit S [Bacteroidota bacterium]HRK04433.1 restriction endonuclease subunit S [Chlorobiota bacterium]
MSTQLTKTTLGDIADFVSGGTPSKSCSDYWTGNIPWVSAKDMKRFRLYDTQDHVSESALRSGARLIPAGTVLVLTRGMTLLNDVPVCIAKRAMTFNQDVKALLPRSQVAPEYLPYVLLGKKEVLLAKVDLAGHGTGRLNSDDLKALEVELPPLPEQRRIAKILGDLDDKIELNRTMNETLEAMARALFKSWFVDFDPVRAKMEGRQPEGMDAETAALFPDKLVESELGMIPEGWEVKTLGQIADVIDCLHSKKPERTLDGGLYLQLNNIRNDGLIDISDGFYIGPDDYANWTSRMEAVAGDCVITNVGRVGAVGQIPEGVRAALGRNMTGIRKKDDFPFSGFLVECLRSEQMLNEIQLKTDTGTILDALNVKSIPMLRFVQPPIVILERFESVARPLRREMEENLSNSHSLATLRDTLLPELMSGEIANDEFGA